MTSSKVTLTVTLLSLVLAATAPAQGDEKANMRTWTSTAGTQVRALLVDVQGQQVRLRRENGLVISVPIDKLSANDQEYIVQWLNRRAGRPSGSDDGGEETPSRGNVVEFAPLVGGAAAPESPAGSPATQEVVADGVGIDPERAVQNAFTRAIEQVVGILVDAESLVENDELIRDQVLTHSRGYVQKFDVLKRWEDDGVHHARIRAVVARTKLVERLEASNITVRALPGERMALQAEHEVVTEQNAAEMFYKTMDQFRLQNLFEVTVTGEPEVIEQDATHAKVRVRVELTPKRDNWVKLRDQLLPLLRKISQSRHLLHGGGWRRTSRCTILLCGLGAERRSYDTPKG